MIQLILFSGEHCSGGSFKHGSSFQTQELTFLIFLLSAHIAHPVRGASMQKIILSVMTLLHINS